MHLREFYANSSQFRRDLPGPVRIADVPAYVRKLGFSTDQDEEILVLFASQAAAAIANARTYRAERRARAETVRAEEIVLTTPDGRALTSGNRARVLPARRAHRIELREHRARQPPLRLGDYNDG